ncbi:MAG: HIT family protein [Hyphomicrobiales bacterium]
MTTPNATMTKFGYPHTLVRKFEHWCVLLRPAQATLGALVLVCKDEAGAFPDISPEAFAELAVATGQIEATLKAFRPYEKINYLMLMMVDPDVHFHILPRYSETQNFAGTAFPDAGWPAVPDLGAGVMLDETLKEQLVDALKKHWVS